MTERLHIAHVSQSAGGVETYLVMLFRHLDRERFRHSLICPSVSTSLIESARELGVEVHVVDMVRAISPWRDLTHVVQIARILRGLSPDIMHAHSSKAGVLGRLAALMAGVPACYTPHAFAFLADQGWRGAMYRAIEYVLRPLTNTLVAGSASEAERARADVGFPPEKIRIFCNSLEIGETQLHSAPSASSGGPLVMMIGRFIYQKNPEMFVRVAARIRAVMPTCSFEIIGTGFEDYQQAEIRALGEHLDVRDCLRLIPWMPRDEMLKRLSHASLLLVPSRFESFGYVAAEAGVLGVPVVATDVDGLKDVVEDGASGYLVELDDDEAMTERALQILGDRSLAESLGRDGQSRVARLFDIEANIQDLEAIYMAVARRV